MVKNIWIIGHRRVPLLYPCKSISLVSMDVLCITCIFEILYCWLLQCRVLVALFGGNFHPCQNNQRHVNATRRRHHPLNWPPSGQGHTVKLIMHFSFGKTPLSLCWLVIFACHLAKPTHFSLQLVDCKIEKVEVSILMMNYGLCNYEFQTSFFVFVLHGRHAHHVVQNWFHPDRV